MTAKYYITTARNGMHKSLFRIEGSKDLYGYNFSSKQFVLLTDDIYQYSVPQRCTEISKEEAFLYILEEM